MPDGGTRVSDRYNVMLYFGRNCFLLVGWRQQGNYLEHCESYGIGGECQCWHNMVNYAGVRISV